MKQLKTFVLAGLAVIMTASVPFEAAHASGATGGGTKCQTVINTSSTSAILCASIYQASFGNEIPYGKLIVNLNRPSHTSATIKVEMCNSSSSGGCLSLVSYSPVQTFSITTVWNAKKCSTIIRGGTVFNGSTACQNGGKYYDRNPGRWYTSRATLYINGVKQGSSVVSPPQRMG